MGDKRSSLSAQWVLDGGILRPPVNLSQDFLLWLSEREGNDSSITFEFSQPAAEPQKILSSLLEYAGGPFAAICQQPFAEKQSKKVSLSAEDDPLTFRYIRNYLYMNPMTPIVEKHWGDLPLNSILNVIRAAHRWQLHSLLAGFCKILLSYDMFSYDDNVLEAIDITRLPDVPQDLQVYFWTKVGEVYREIAIHYLVEDTNSKNVEKEKSKKNKDENNDEDRDDSWIDIINAKQRENVNASMAASPSQFPDLWAIAVNQKMVSYLLHSIVNNITQIGEYKELNDKGCSSLYHDHLEMIVLGFLEPRINDDSYLLDVLSLLRWPAFRWTMLVQNDKSYSSYSSRAMTLVARHLISSNVIRDEVRTSWEINLHAMDNSMEVEKHFLVPMLEMASSRKRSRHTFFSDPILHQYEAGISFSISIAKMRTASEFSIDTSWNPVDWSSMRKNFPSGYIRVKVINNGCKCQQWYPLPSHSTSGVIAEDAYMLWESQGFRSLVIDEILLAEYRRVHGKKCRVTISIEVREK